MTNGRFVIIPAPGGPDPNIGALLNTCYPGEPYTARIGDISGGGHIDQLKYQIAVGANNNFFIYRYAAVLEDIDHDPDERPRLTIEIKDPATGLVLDSVCGYYNVYANQPGTTGWVLTNGHYWKDWTTVGMDLSPWINQTVEIDFTVNGCCYTAHKGYAYISAFCSSMTIDIAGCEGSGVVTMTAPPGFAQYKWSGPYCADPILCPLPAPIYYGQSCTITTATGAATGNRFELDLTALNGCTVQRIAEYIVFTSVDANFSSVINCVGNSSSFTDISTTTNISQPIVKRRWRFDTDSAFTAVTTNATITHTYNVIGPHVVTIESLSQDSCMGTITDTINVGPPPMFINLPPGPEKPICSGDKAAITLEFTQTGADATWTYQITSGTPVISKNPVNQSGLTINDTITNSGPGDAVVTYTITPRIGDCTGVDTTFQVTVNPLPVPLISGFATVCAGTIDVSYSTETGKTNYAWVVSSGGIITGGQGSDSILVTWNAPGMQTVSANYTDPNGCDAMAPTVINVTVNPVPTANSVSNQVLCHNAQTSVVSFSGNVPGTVFNWVNSNTSIGLAVSGSGNIASFTATNTSFVPITATITVTPVFTNAGVTCTGTSTFFTITVNPIPNINPVTNQVLCHNTQTSLVSFAGDAPGSVFNWTNSQPSIGIAASGTGNISVFTATNTSTSPVTATITVTPQFTNAGTTCTGTATSFTIKVNPIPAVNPIISQVLCHNSPTSLISISGDVPGTVYNWVNSNTSIGLGAG
ncbi:MAG: PKD-like domain-containing protein, partial [Bacteroidota bacterium]